MGKYSSFSQKRKPLFFASLAVSLALHAGGLYFLTQHPFSFTKSYAKETDHPVRVEDLEIEFALSETFNRLLTKEEEKHAPLLGHPQMELRDQQLRIITNFSYAPSLSFSSSSPPAFQMEEPTFSILEKHTHFAEKKPLVFFKSVTLETLVKQSEKTKIFTPKEQVSSIQINPVIETREKRSFERGSLYFFYEGEIEETYPLCLLPPEVDVKRPSSKSFPPPKTPLETTTRIGTSFFASIAPLDLSSLTEEMGALAPQPVSEIVAPFTPLLKEKLPNIALSETFPSDVNFELTPPHFTPLQLKSHFQKPTLRLEHSFAAAIPPHLPELSDGEHVFSPKKDLFLPQQENVESLTFGSEFSLSTSEKTVNSPFSSFDFSADSPPLQEIQPQVPKHSLSAASSTLSIPKNKSALHPVSKPSVNKNVTVLPKSEDVAPLAFSDSHQSLSLEEVVPTPDSSLALRAYIPSSLPLSQRKIDLSKPSLETHPSPLEKASLPPLNSAMAAQKKESKPALPSTETAPLLALQNEIPSPELPLLAQSDSPEFALKKANVPLSESKFSYAKMQPERPDELAVPHLPHLQEKKITSGKMLTSTSTDLPSKEHSSLTTQPRHESAKETKITIASSREVKDLETSEIHSNAKELIKNHHEKTLAQTGDVKIATPMLATILNEKDVHTVNETLRFTAGDLAEMPAPSHLETVSFDNEFETTVTYVPKSDGKGYQFALKMKPSKNLYFASPEQNIIFVIDGSTTIKNHRYTTFKDAVTKALGYMHDGDTFNILVADSEISPMSKSSLTWSKNSVKQARSYLRTRNYRGYFSKYDAFHLIDKASEFFDPDKENIIVFMTDGHSLESIKKSKEQFQTLGAKSKGPFSLFTACASQGNNFSMLDLISTFNNGEFMYSPTNAAFPRKLAVLVRHIESCIAQNIRIHVTSNTQTKIQFYPNQESYPALYADRAYTLYGTIDKLEDFDLILQAQAGGQWVNIKQRVSFSQAEEAGYKLKRNFALQEAYSCYDYYLKKDDPFYLAEAERILSPHSIAPATR